jgi:AcrR family transcriptional regulator
MAKGVNTTRRTGEARVGGRAAGVVERVVAATFEELSRVGYTAMRVEDVAIRSGVNKTTIYRRWPTKAALLTAALMQVAERRVPVIDTGTLKGDLQASLFAAFDLSPYEQGVLRAIQTERSQEAVEKFASKMRDELRETRIAMVERGIARGELPQGVDPALLVELVSAPVQRALLFNETMDAATISRMLDIVLAGAAAVPQPARATNRSAAGGRRAKKP